LSYLSGLQEQKQLRSSVRGTWRRDGVDVEEVEDRFVASAPFSTNKVCCTLIEIYGHCAQNPAAILPYELFSASLA